MAIFLRQGELDGSRDTIDTIDHVQDDLEPLDNLENGGIRPLDHLKAGTVPGIIPVRSRSWRSNSTTHS